MKVRYKGPNIGCTGLTNNAIYTVLEIDEITGALRIIDDSEEECGYLYDPKYPKALCGDYNGGMFEIVEDEDGILDSAING